jgi:peptidoglycan/LPS O-acetylase OafA/YrhL
MSERFGYSVAAAMVLAQGLLIRSGAGFWALVAPVMLVGLCLAVASFKNEKGRIEKPARAYFAVVAFGAIAGAFFWLAPDYPSVKLQLFRVTVLDIAIVLFACVAGTHARGHVRPA